jgi:hypothetical protein
MAVQLVLGIISTIVLLIVLIRTRMGLQDRSFRFIFVLLFLMCIFAIGLAACVPENERPFVPGGGGSNIPPPTISGSNPLQTGTPCLAQVTTGQNCGNSATATATWGVTFDYSENGTQLANGYRVTDPVNTHYIVVHLTFTNNTSQAQELQTGQDIYLQGSDGQRYSEDQGSNPSNVLQFTPGETQHVYTAYVVPDSVCNYTLVVANPGGQDLTWSITVTDSNYCRT